MKRTFIIILLCYSFFALGQEKEDINLLVTEEGWRKEAFRFPIPFAKTIDFDGVADVRFTKGWEDKNNSNFWSYAFAWQLMLNKKLLETDIENYMQLYFDGLMNVVNKDKSKIVSPTLALFTATESGKGINYKGKIRFYDAFFTQKMMTLNVLGKYTYCKKHDKSIYVFKLSPKQLDSPVWTHIKKAVLRKDICELK